MFVTMPTVFGLWGGARGWHAPARLPQWMFRGVHFSAKNRRQQHALARRALAHMPHTGRRSARARAALRNLRLCQNPFEALSHP